MKLSVPEGYEHPIWQSPLVRSKSSDLFLML
jgi:hypothetical protein